ncbi:MAG TPA: hypothetical protein VFI31_22860 [Pirellulales bacterium]|nr:hypothetical protein [Pirellulales bacterium]
MRLRWMLAAAMILGTSNTGWARAHRAWNDLAPGPKVTGYNQEKDEIYHQESVVSAANRHRPGGEHAYSGNRLDAFQFHGKTGRGGLYDALDDYKRKLNPKNYQYRQR